jgi:hypothetical protein
VPGRVSTNWIALLSRDGSNPVLTKVFYQAQMFPISHPGSIWRWGVWLGIICDGNQAKRERGRGRESELVLTLA